MVGAHDDHRDALPTAGEHAVFASARLFTADDTTVGVATFDPADLGRELGDGRVLTGWSFLVGDETAEEVADPEAIRMPSLRVMLERCPEVAGVLDGHDGTAASYVRDGRAGDGPDGPIGRRRTPCRRRVLSV